MTQSVDRLLILTRQRVCNDFSDLPLLSVSNYYATIKITSPRSWTAVYIRIRDSPSIMA